MGLLGKANAKSDNVLNEDVVADAIADAISDAVSDTVSSATSDTSSDAISVDIRAFSIDIQALIDRFYLKNHLFHCLLLRSESGDKRGFLEIAGMADSFGIECSCLPDGDCLVLLPGSLDLGLFSHRLSKSSGSTVILQFSADSASFAFEKIALNDE
jgi:hypothetical protein